MFSIATDSSIKKKGKQATKGHAQIFKENEQTIEFYKHVLLITNGIFIVVHFIFYFISGLSFLSLIFFTSSNAIAWYVWLFMRRTATATDLNLEGSISEYGKDIILTIIITQCASLFHRYCWSLLFAIPIYAIYRLVSLFFFSTFAQLRANDNNDDDQKKVVKRKIVRMERR